MFKVQLGVAVMVATLAFACHSLAGASSAKLIAHGAPNLSLTSGAPLTAVELALQRGATGPRDALARRNVSHHAPNPPIPPFIAWYNAGTSFGYWEWICTGASCVPTTLLPTGLDHVPWFISPRVKCTGCVPWVTSSGTGPSRAINLLSKHWLPLGELTNGITGQPVGVAQDLAGNIYVALHGANPDVQVYASGSQTPTQTLVDTNLSFLYYVAVDKAGDVFVDGLNAQSAFEVDEMVAGSGIFAQLPISGLFPGGIAVDKHENLWVDDQGDGSSGTISMYPPPYQTFTTSFTYTGDNAQISLDSTNTMLVAANDFIAGTLENSEPVVYSLPSGAVLATGTSSASNMLAVSFKKPSKI